MTPFEELEQRVARLEQRLAEVGTSEALQPSYLTVDPATGQVGADFTGHVHATGLDLDVAITRPDPIDLVSWLRRATAGNNAAGDPAIAAALSGQSTTGAPPVGQLYGIVNSDQGVIPNAPSRTRLIVDSLGESDFLQLAVTAKSLCHWGQVSAAGAVARDGSASWTVARTAVGTYTITWGIAAGGQAAIPIVTPITTAQSAVVTALSGLAFTVVTLTAAGAAVDSDFGFIAIGRP